MSLSPALRPCSPDPVCGPAPVPRLPSKSGWRHLVDSIGSAYRTWRHRERLYAEMSRLDHRELRDLGISQADIGDVVARSRPRR